MHRKRFHSHRHNNLAEHKISAPPALPATPPPAVYAANVFGKFALPIQHAIAEMNYSVPTPIQEQAISHLLEGRDLIGCAQTGTGKTAAFMLPILERLISQPPIGKFRAGHPRALILSPTRELAAQIAENALAYSKFTATPLAVIFGGVPQFHQVKAIQAGAQIVIATPGRLIDLMTQGVIFLDAIEEFVLDEADRMLDMGFIPDIRRIISKLPAVRHSSFFSATLAPAIMKLANELVRDAVSISVSPQTPTVEKINQRCMFVEKGNRDALLLHLLANHPEWNRVIVFAKMRHAADRVARKLLRADIPVAAIHSDKTQNQRVRALEGFKAGRVRVLVATDIASRGIDVPDVDLVVNMELPMELESYVHRIGRTARAGAKGCAISFITPEDRARLKAVERFIKKTIPVDRDHPFHSDAADTKRSEGLPTAPWVNTKKSAPPRRKQHSLGRRQPDFGQKHK